MELNEYAVDEQGWWYKWNPRWLKYVSLKKEYWPPSKQEKKMRTTVLIVDDDNLIRDCIASLLAMSDYNILQAEDAVEVVSVLKKAQVDIILSDVRMPGLSGPEMYESLGNSKPPIIFMSGGCDKKQTDKISRIGAPFLLKPFQKEALVSLIEKLVIKA